MNRKHQYKVSVKWIGNCGTGTSGYKDYERDHLITSEKKEEIAGSSDPAFRGNRSKYSPEELLVSSLSTCHMLWYLHLCAEAGVIVMEYEDKATGIMGETADGSGRFESVTLHPVVTVTDQAMIEKADEIHVEANRLCFIANSVNFSVFHQPETRVLHAYNELEK